MNHVVLRSTLRTECGNAARVFVTGQSMKCRLFKPVQWAPALYCRAYPGRYAMCCGHIDLISGGPDTPRHPPSGHQPSPNAPGCVRPAPDLSGDAREQMTCAQDPLQHAREREQSTSTQPQVARARDRVGLSPKETGRERARSAPDQPQVARARDRVGLKPKKNGREGVRSAPDQLKGARELLETAPKPK